MFHFIPIAYASSHIATSQGLVDKINSAILFPLIALMMALAFIIFLWGAFEYVKNANNEAARETGRNHLMYGVIGMLIMLSAFAILSIAAGTFGIDVPTSSAPTTSLRPQARPDRAPVGVPSTGIAVPSSPTAVIPSPTTADPIPVGGDGLDLSDPPAGIIAPDNAGVSTPTTPITVNQQDFQSVRTNLISNGVSSSMADAVVAGLQYSNNNIALRDNLDGYVQEQLLSQSVADETFRTIMSRF